MAIGSVPPQDEQRWTGRPWLARGVRAGVVLAPIAVAIGCSSLVSRALPVPVSTSGLMTWWAIVLVVSTLALVVTDRFARRLLPLSLLLKLSLPFPDAPPSRIKVAIRSGSSRQLAKWADSVAGRDGTDPKAVAAHDLLGLVAALSAHDRRSRGHSERVRVYTDLMAEQLGLSRDEADKLRWASLLHDIGKLRVRSEILNKPGAPDAIEWETLRQHPSEGDRLIEPVRAWLGPWSKAVMEHHERWDGTGYPRGLAGTEISLGGRIVAVTDSYEVMTATRSYKKPMSVKAAREELTRSAGTHFDPAMVRAFLSVPIGRVGWASGPIAWIVQLPFLAQIPTVGATAIVATSIAVTAPFVTSVAVENAPPAVEVVDPAADSAEPPDGTVVLRTPPTTGGNPSESTPGQSAGAPGQVKDETTTPSTDTADTADTADTTDTANATSNGNPNDKEPKVKDPKVKGPKPKDPKAK